MNVTLKNIAIALLFATTFQLSCSAQPRTRQSGVAKTPLSILEEELYKATDFDKYTEILRRARKINPDYLSEESIASGIPNSKNVKIALFHGLFYLINHKRKMLTTFKNLKDSEDTPIDIKVLMNIIGVKVMYDGLVNLVRKITTSSHLVADIQNKVNDELGELDINFRAKLPSIGIYMVQHEQFKQHLITTCRDNGLDENVVPAMILGSVVGILYRR